MATLDQLTTQIRFGLEQLSAKNAQHEFEHLCRHFARARICSNILPATGPVSAGGDQGRDFETFCSYLSQSALGVSSFAGRLSEGPLAFGCTLQKDTTKSPLATKIKADISTITASGTSVIAVHYFTTSDFPTAKRHAVQEWCRREKGVELEVYDGQALSELLSERDVFWIATRFLAIPSDLYPRDKDSSDGGYQAVYEEWKSADIDPESYSQFQELKNIVRQVTWEDSVKNDLPFWIGLLDAYIANDDAEDLKRMATYESTVATLRGLGNLLGKEDGLTWFFDSFEPALSIGRLEDTVILLTYCVSAQVMNHAAFDLSLLAAWHERLTAYVDKELEDRRFPSTVAYLLQMRGMLSVHKPSPEGIAFDLDSQMEWYSKLSDILPEAHLYPVERFADTITGLCDHIGEHPLYDQITEKVDAVIGSRIGGFSVAEKCRDRAIVFRDKGQLLKAVREIHKAKINWYASETLRGCVLSLLILARWYTELGLAFAGKYYALAAVYICVNDDNPSLKPLAWEAAIEASHCDYILGASVGFVDLVALAKHLHRTYDVLLELEEGSTLEAVILHCSWTVYLSERLESPAAESLRERVDDIGLGEPYANCLAAMREECDPKPVEELMSWIPGQLQGVPVTDIGLTRTAAWSSLGVEWHVNWQNDYATNVLAEQFIACLQIMQCELAGHDLCLPETQVTVDFCVAAVESLRVEPALEAASFRWRLDWPRDEPTSSADDAFVPTFVAAVMLLGNVSFKKQESIDELLEALFRAGVPGKTIVAQSYAQAYRDFVSEEFFNQSRRVFVAGEHSGEKEIPVQPRPELGQATGPGPGYSKEAAETAIVNRCKWTTENLPATLGALRADADFMAVAKRLRDEGWKDWHVVTAVITTALNASFRAKHGNTTDIDLLKEHMAEFMACPEPDNQMTTPLSAYNYDALCIHRRGNLQSVLHSWGFETHHPAFTPDVTEAFLANRFAYWEDDIEEPDVFPLAGGGVQDAEPS